MRPRKLFYYTRTRAHTLLRPNATATRTRAHHLACKCLLLLILLLCRIEKKKKERKREPIVLLLFSSWTPFFFPFFFFGTLMSLAVINLFFCSWSLVLRGNNYFFLERKGFWLEKCSTMFDELNFFFGIFIYGTFYSYLSSWEFQLVWKIEGKMKIL